MVKLTLVQTNVKPNTNLATHRASATEGEAAKRLLESQGYTLKRKANGQYEFPCPFHEGPGSLERGKSANFYLNATTSEYFCQSASCGERGNLQLLERHFGIGFDEGYVSTFRDRDTRLKEFERNLTTALRTPFYEHGLTDATIERFRLGYEMEHVETREIDGVTKSINIPGRYVIPYLEGRRPKFFRYYSPNGDPKWKYTWEEGAESTLFNAQDALGDSEGTVYLCEGEQKAMLLVQMGYAAVGVPGASHWKDEFQAAFTHARRVIIVFDNDNPLFHHYDQPDKDILCRKCSGKGLDRCVGHNPGQEAALRRLEQIGWRAKNIVLPLPDEQTKKTDVNDYFMRDGHTNADFAELCTGKRATPYKVQSLAEINETPPEEAEFLVEQGILSKGGRLLIAGKPKVGKAQPLSTPILTPQGWVTMGELRVGSEVIGSNGRPTRVTHLHPQGEKEVYRVEFSDGSSTLACADHLWQIQTHNDRTHGRSRVLDTLQVRDMLEHGQRETYVPMVAPVEYVATKTLPLSPYALGLLLGDGSFRQTTPTFTSADAELFSALDKEIPVEVRRFDSYGARLTNGWGTGANPITSILRELGLWGHKSESKFIPERYLRASIDDRLALLQGLMDTDGGMTNNSSQFYTSSLMLAEGVLEIVRSLGGVAVLSEKPTTHLLSYRVTLRLPGEMGPPFRLPRKVAAWSNGRTKRAPSHRITSVTLVGTEESQCITVEAEDHLYVTEDFILTHNSIFVDNLALSLSAGIPFLKSGAFPGFAVDHPTRTMLLDRELSKWSLFKRLTQLSDERPGYRAAYENLLIDHDHLIRLDQPNAFDTLRGLVEQNGAEVIILDTAYKFFGGDVESSSSVMKGFEVLDKLLHETGCSVILTHHLKKGQTTGKQNKDEADPDGVAGSFLWTGWPNGTILLNYLNRSVENPFNSVATFTAFRDAAPPEPVALYRNRESISYSSVQRYVYEEEATSHQVKVTRPTTDAVEELLLEVAPVTEDEFLHMAAGRFGVSIPTIKPYYIDALARGNFTKTRGNPPIVKYKFEPEEEQSWESEHGLPERSLPDDTIPMFETVGLGVES